MKKTICLFLIYCGITLNSNAQIPFPDMIINNQTFSTGVHNIYNSTSIISPDDVTKPVIVTNNANVEYKAGKSIELNPGFSVSALNTGSFHALIEPNPFEIVIMAPISTPGHVGKYEKFETGVKLPQTITDNINNYINNHDETGLNPFDPDQISIEATFTSPSNIVKTIYGFYYKEFERDINLPNHVDDTWDIIPTDYPWRIRFAPDELGTWKMSVNVTVNYNGTSTYSVNDLSFICDVSTNPGYLEVGNYKRNLRFSGTKNSFFAIGENVADAVYTCWTPTVPASYLEYEHDLTELSNAGGNYIRHFMVDNHSIEWQGYYSNQMLTNFNFGAASNSPPNTLNFPNKGQINAWELDQLFELAKDKGIYIHLTLDNYSAYLNGTSTKPGSWYDGNPYYGLVNTQLEFFQGVNNSKEIYKKRLRYIVARWGYSTNLACYELFNEVDQIDRLYYLETDPDFMHNQAGQTAISEWIIEMASYIKTIDKNHLVTNSYAGPHGSFDHSNESDNIDITSIHNYEPPDDNGGDYKIRDININRFGSLYGGSFMYNSIGQMINKPIIIGECGMSSGDDVHHPEYKGEKPAYCSDVSFHNVLWSSAFMGGFGSGLNWNTGPIHSFFPETFLTGCEPPMAFAYPYPDNYSAPDPPNKITDYYKNIKALSSFIQYQNIDFENEDFIPQENTSTNPHGLNHKDLESFTIANNFGTKAYGWMHQRDYYWRNLANYYPSLSLFGASASGPGIVHSGEQLYVHDLALYTRFIISLWRTPHDGSSSTLYSTTNPIYSNLWGALKKGFSDDFYWAPDYAYVITKYNNKENENIKLLYDTLNCPTDTIFATGIYEGDTSGINNYYWDFGNGQISTEYHPKIFYNQPGKYMVTLIINDSLGNNIDTLKQLEVVINCDSILPDTNTIRGILTENNTCGGASIINDTLQLVSSNNNIVYDITAALTDSTGKFIFDKWEIYRLDTTALFGLRAKSGIALNDTVHKTIPQWIRESPLNLYYTASVKQEWVARYNGTDSLIDGATAVDLQGNVYVTGATTSSTTSYNMLTIKYNPAGVQQWAQIYTGNNNYYNDVSRAITVDTSGNVYITGESYPTSSRVFTTISYTSGGTQRWVQTYTTYGGQASNKCIMQDHAGNIIVGGTSTGTAGSTYYTVLKYSSTGTLLWSANYAGPASPHLDVLKALTVDASNNVYASGYSMGVGTNYDITTVKLSSSNGSQLWVARYNNADNGDDFGYSNAISNNGNIIVTGNAHRNSGNDEVVVISYNPSSTTPNWVSIYNTDTHDYAYQALCNDANNIYIGGYKGDANTSGLLALKYNASGNLLWYKNSLYDSLFVFKSAGLDVADNLYCTGTTKNNNGYSDITTQKLNSSGDIQWRVTYNGTGNNIDVPTQVMISDNGNAYVCGNSIGNSTNYDFITIKYSQCLSTAANLRTSGSNLPPIAVYSVKENSSVQVIPNPNNGNMQVYYQIPENSTGSLDVYNFIGEKLFSYPLYGGRNSFLISHTELNQGIYFYRAIVGNKQIASDKIVVIK